jgi:hypothetical protein
VRAGRQPGHSQAPRGAHRQRNSPIQYQPDTAVEATTTPITQQHPAAIPLITTKAPPQACPASGFSSRLYRGPSVGGTMSYRALYSRGTASQRAPWPADASGSAGDSLSSLAAIAQQHGIVLFAAFPHSTPVSRANLPAVAGAGAAQPPGAAPSRLAHHP